MSIALSNKLLLVVSNGGGLSGSAVTVFGLELTDEAFHGLLVVGLVGGMGAVGGGNLGVKLLVVLSASFSQFLFKIGFKLRKVREVDGKKISIAKTKSISMSTNKSKDKKQMLVQFQGFVRFVL